MRFYSFKSEVLKQIREVLVFREPHSELGEQLLELRKVVSTYSSLSSELSETQIAEAVTLLQNLSQWLEPSEDEAVAAPFARVYLYEPYIFCRVV